MKIRGNYWKSRYLFLFHLSTCFFVCLFGWFLKNHTVLDNTSKRIRTTALPHTSYILLLQLESCYFHAGPFSSSAWCFFTMRHKITFQNLHPLCSSLEERAANLQTAETITIFKKQLKTHSINLNQCTCKPKHRRSSSFSPLNFSSALACVLI